MANETVEKNSIKIFSSNKMADLAYDINSSYVLNFSFITSFKSELKKVFGKDAPLITEEPLEDISGYFTITPKGLRSVLACLSRVDSSTFVATSQSDFNEFHVVANCYDPTSTSSYVGYYCGFCRMKKLPYSDFSDVSAPVRFDFSGGFLKSALGAFDANSAAGTNSANQEVAFAKTPVMFEGNYAASVFLDDALLLKGVDYSEDVTKVTVFGMVPTTSKVTVVSIYSP